jgi:predicted metalloendopeptidase
VLVWRCRFPDRDYYVSEDADSKEKKEKYVLHVAKMLGFLVKNLQKLKYMQNKF